MDTHLIPGELITAVVLRRRRKVGRSIARSGTGRPTPRAWPASPSRAGTSPWELWRTNPGAAPTPRPRSPPAPRPPRPSPSNWNRPARTAATASRSISCAGWSLPPSIRPTGEAHELRRRLEAASNRSRKPRRQHRQGCGPLRRPAEGYRDRPLTLTRSSPPSPPAYGVMVSAPIARGRIIAIDTAAAEASPGVRLVWTHENAPAQGPRPDRYDFFTPSPRPALESEQVHFFGQQVAVVVADTLENAQAAAALVNLTFEGRRQGGDLPRPLRRGRAAARRAGRRDRRLRGWLRRRAGADRRYLAHAAAEPLPDGALRHHRMVGRRPPDRPHLGPDGAVRPELARRDPDAAAQERAAADPLCRRRLRRQGLVLRGPGAGFAGRPRTRPAGEDRLLSASR